MLYDLIIADPPWSYYGDPSKDQAAGKHYDLMTTEEIAAIELPLARDGVLFLWATCPRLDQAIALIDKWGLHFRGVAFVWIKTRKDGQIIGAQGVRPTTVKRITELVLVASHKKKGRPMPLKSESIRQVVLAPRPGGIHSAKPEAVQDRIEELYGDDCTRLEMFARRKRTGWDDWGNEAPTTIKLLSE